MREPELAFDINTTIDGSEFEHSGGGFYINEEDVVVWCQMCWSIRIDLGCAIPAHQSFSNQNEAQER